MNAKEQEKGNAYRYPEIDEQRGSNQAACHLGSNIAVPNRVDDCAKKKRLGEIKPC